MTDKLIEQIKADREAGTPGRWAYRPQKYDDWGYVRGAEEADGFYPFICQAKDMRAMEDDVLNEHRRNGTDPWAANARRIARVPEYEARILADEQVIKAAEMLAKVLDNVTGKTWAATVDMGDACKVDAAVDAFYRAMQSRAD